MSSNKNENHAATEKQTFKRGYKACLNCKMRKVKCDLGPYDNPHGPPCVRCKREGRECIFTKTKRGGFRVAKQSLVTLKEESAGKSMADVITSVIQGQSLKKELDTNLDRLRSRAEDDITITADPPTLQNAFYFLAKAAGSVAKEDLRDQVDAASKYDEVESSGSAPRQPSTSAYSVAQGPASVEALLNSKIRNGSDAVAFMEPEGNIPGTIPLIEKLSSVRPNPSMKLSDVDFIGPYQLLTEAEARKRIDAFFLTMHPFSPYIPLQLQDPNELAKYPLLLCTILTVSARYHTLHDLGLSDIENTAHIELHDRLWIYCQRLVSQTVWAEASTRSIGTILAFFMFTEWNPRAIHWRWSDYANYPDISDVPKPPPSQTSESKGGESLAGLAAMRRSDRMSWMLTGNAVRLAQDLNVIEFSSKIFVMTHTCETHTAMNLNKRSSLSESLSEVKLNGFEDNDLDNEQFFLERILKNDESKERWARFLERIGGKNKKGSLTDVEREFLNDEYLLYHYNTESSNLQADPEFRLKFSKAQRGKVELLKIISLGYENVYNGKLSSRDRHQRLSMLSVLSPLIEGWYNTYKALLVPCGGAPCSLGKSSNRNVVFEMTENMERESIISDYYYCQIYIYSLALQWDNQEENTSKLRLNEITKSARYVELAYNAAKEILNSAQRVHKLKLLKYMPVRWVMRIVRSIVFMIKCYLTLTGNGITQNPEANTILTMSVLPTDEIIQTIQRTAIMLRAAAPDKLHLCSRYSTILMYLCTEMKHRCKPNMQPPMPRSISNEFSKKDDTNAETAVESAHINYTAEGHHLSDNPNVSTFPFIGNTAYPSGAAAAYDGTEGLKGQEATNFEHQRTTFEENPASGSKPTAKDSSGVALPSATHDANVESNSDGGYLPSQIVDWFNDNNEIGLDFVGPWTEMVEQQFVNKVDDSSYENWFEEFYTPPK
ncbi:unnamed protein product [Kluyveromyces dobzhanskii CBS 2104]|uniref:WGS project CCBQ000000000 data, contig 00028 n=1 Tax=Kluyveromyces dobzhanskii CBS 2104 TaxID=1427455 RepID=A0A0A8L0Q2_9SACH|nr:unnamed protein product [Kluyveromyces dobzhanskii CBS 2104]